MIPPVKKICLLGATGSIGQSTLDVIARHPDRFQVVALAAHSNWQKILTQCERFNPQYAVLLDEPACKNLRHALTEKKLATEVLTGQQSLCDIARLSEVDTVIAAIVGAAGLLPTLAAAQSGKRILLANKETLVMAGPVFIDAVRHGGATILPVDSEHNAVFQCLPPDGFAASGAKRILLTASGGPFLYTPIEQLVHITPAQACAHPKWAMGRKISVDSATMMNKGLEVIEAHWLFGAPAEQIEVLVHPQSIVHSLVEYRDGSVLAQLSNPDMRTPIAQALAYPERIEAGVSMLNLKQIGNLEFIAPDPTRFPCLKLAYTALQIGGSAATVLNAANEVAVSAFLENRLSFLQIYAICSEVLARVPVNQINTLDDALAVDQIARKEADRLIARDKFAVIP